MPAWRDGGRGAPCVRRSHTTAAATAAIATYPAPVVVQTPPPVTVIQTPAPAAQPSAAQKLKELESLYKQGLITSPTTRQRRTRSCSRSCSERSACDYRFDYKEPNMQRAHSSWPHSH